MEEEVVLVDPIDNVVGTAPKLRAHQEGLLHRAISVFVYNAAGELLLQRRAGGKYHSAGLWTNSCCSHPRPDEKPHQAAVRRLREEMGIEVDLDYALSFLYHAKLENGLIEHELDHVFVGRYEGDPLPDPDEVDGWRWVAPEILRGELDHAPERFTAWFPMALELIKKKGFPRPAGRGQGLHR